MNHSAPVAALTVLLLCSGTPAQAANFISGNDLKGYCDRGSAACAGYVMGVTDGFLFEDQKTGTKPEMCLPSGITGNQLTDMTKQYLEANPDKRHWAASVLVWNALAAKFWCGKKDRAG
jgi:hypothetical protein